MPLPQKIQGSSYAVLRIRNCYQVFDTNGQKKLVENVFYYGPGANNACGVTPFSASSKNGLVTYAGNLVYGGVTYNGFQATVVAILNALLNKGAVSFGIYAKWLDVTNDADVQVGTYAPTTIPPVAATVGNGAAGGGGVGTIATRMPLPNHVTVRKATGVAGKEWSRGRFKFAPIDESQVAGDELTAGAQTAWAALKVPLYSAITDGTLSGGVPNLLYPILVSTKLSQLRRMPTRIAFAPLALPAVNVINGILYPVINASIGEQKRRKEKPDVVF